jgi:hypothetical protein
MFFHGIYTAFSRSLLDLKQVQDCFSGYEDDGKDKENPEGFFQGFLVVF